MTREMDIKNLVLMLEVSERRWYKMRGRRLRGNLRVAGIWNVVPEEKVKKDSQNIQDLS